MLGSTTTGDPVIMDLVHLPHLLVAGSTGTGKSVALNTMLVSLLYSKTPDELRIILIDPKRLEFSAYNDVAHLLFPIITAPEKTVPILRWVVREMGQRYDKMGALGVRNIEEYNSVMVETKGEGAPIFAYLVIIIDEFADLIMSVGKEMEDLVARIAQMARAAGIHIIVATQRPSVDVITGIIKANFPSRISFRVSSKVDSRTILDSVGAEKLLGKGDMLFLGSRSIAMERIHGAYVSDAEITRLVSHIRSQRAVSYTTIDDELLSKLPSINEKDDPLYCEIKKYLKGTEEISISQIQRHFRIGYNRSARIVEMLEYEGMVMPVQGGKLRKVIQQISNDQKE